MPVNRGIVISSLPGLEIESMPSQFDPPSAIQVLQKTVATAGTPVRATATPTPLKQGALIKSHSTNSGIVYVGGSGVSAANSFQLDPGEQFMFSIDDLSKVWFDASVDAHVVSVHYV